MSTNRYTIAIVGMGPRGSYALECLIASLDDSPDAALVHVLLFDDATFVGAGPVYDLDQPESNWINISERALELDGRAETVFNGTQVPAFPSYHSWAGLPQKSWPVDVPDTFPPRAQVGRYLHARAQSLVQPLVKAGVATFVDQRVQQLSQIDGKWSIEDSHGQEWSADEVLLTIGHQPTTTDDQIAGWSDQVYSHPGLVLQKDPYPISPIVDHTQKVGGDITVAIRGYGLAMMDVVRRIAVTFGEFVTAVGGDGGTGELVYRLASDGQLQLVPFSLDGLPMSPKPLTPSDDALFAVTDTELSHLEADLRSRHAQLHATNDELLINAMAPIAARVFLDLPYRHADAPTNTVDLEALLSSWLRDADVSHPSLTDHSAPPELLLAGFASMAGGKSPVSVDYCLGQVWRHCHPTIYESLSYNQLDDGALAATIALDERIKRYSFGPPVESIRQLGALVEAGVLNLDFVDDPDIVCDPTGWTLSSNGQEIIASAMVNSVLDGPQLENVVAPLITDLLRSSVIQPVHDKLGISTDDDATVRTGESHASLTLAVLGRLAKGTVVGVDAILECFGDRPRDWAAGAKARVVSSESGHVATS